MIIINENQSMIIIQENFALLLKLTKTQIPAVTTIEPAQLR